MTSSQPAEHDDEVDTETYSISSVEAIAKAAIKAAARRDRWAMWDAYQLAVKDAQASSAEYPWQEPEEIARITARSARSVLTAVHGVVRDPAERNRLAVVMAEEAERVERQEASSPASAIPAGKLPLRHCGQCGREYRPQRIRSVYCSPSCRQGAYKQRKRAARG
jgi:hypothetical protein